VSALRLNSPYLASLFIKKQIMIEPNFVAIGKIPGESIFVHKDDVTLLSNEENTSKIKCIAIDFRSIRTSVPVVIDYLLNVCPHDPVTSEEERDTINKLVKDVLPEKKINNLNKRFEKIKHKVSVKLK
jgi:hypothetical protein